MEGCEVWRVETFGGLRGLEGCEVWRIVMFEWLRGLEGVRFGGL